MDIRALRSEADEVRANINELIGKAGELTDSQVGDPEAAETRLPDLNKPVSSPHLNLPTHSPCYTSIVART